MSETSLSRFGPKVLLMGGSGTGKTYALGTLVDWAAANKSEVFILFAENGLDTLLGYWRDKNLPIPECLHWHEQITRPLNVAALMKMAENVGRLSYENITRLSDPERAQNNAYLAILQSFADFPDDRTGKKFGCPNDWSTNRVFVIDTLSELATAAMKMQIGNKPTASQPDYGVAQNSLINFLRLCTQGCTCPFVLTGHVEREMDLITQSSRIFIKSIGKALAAEIPPLFSDVVLTVREGTNFYWDTAAMGVDLKTRTLGYRTKIEPSFKLLMDTWQKRVAV